MNRADRILALVVIAVALLLGPAARFAAGMGSSASVVTISGPAGITTLSLREDREVTVAGSAGQVVVVVRDGAVRVAESTCPDHVCMRSGAISMPGEALVCVPNGVSVRIGGERGDGLDAVAR